MVTINGEKYAFAGKSLLEGLSALDYDEDRLKTIVIEYNEIILRKEDYEGISLKDGDVMAIVCFMVGGC